MNLKRLIIFLLVMTTLGLVGLIGFIGYQEVVVQEDEPIQSAVGDIGTRFGPGEFVNICGNSFSACNGCDTTSCAGPFVEVYRCAPDDQESNNIECVKDPPVFRQGSDTGDINVGYGTYFNDQTVEYNGMQVPNSCFMYQIDVFPRGSRDILDFVVWRGDDFGDISKCFPQGPTCPNGQIYFREIEGYNIHNNQTQPQMRVPIGESAPSPITFYYDSSESFSGKFRIIKTEFGNLNNQEVTVIDGIGPDTNYDIPLSIEVGYSYQIEAHLDDGSVDSSEMGRCAASQLTILREVDEPTSTPTGTMMPTSTPTNTPTNIPTSSIVPTNTPINSPTPTNTIIPTLNPSVTIQVTSTIANSITPSPTGLICGDPCDPEFGDPCPNDHTCDPETNTCKLNACLEDPSLCSADGCFIVPDTSITDNQYAWKLITGISFTALGLISFGLVVKFKGLDPYSLIERSKLRNKRKRNIESSFG